MASTTYNLTLADGTSVGSKSKKSTAVELARSEAKVQKQDVTITTGAGNVVLTVKAPKHIKMSKPFTRVTEVPEGLVVPDGLRFAYKRGRTGVAVVVDDEIAKGGRQAEPYQLLDLKTGKLRAKHYRTCRDAATAMTELLAERNAKQAELANA